MFDPSRVQWNAPSLVLGTAFGMAATGVAAFVVGALYQCSAFRTSIEDLGQLLVFTPVVVTFICCVALLTYHYRRGAAIILALFSVAGMATMLFQSNWGESILDASPAFTKQYSRYTYAGDVLFFFAQTVQLVGALLALITGKLVRRGSEQHHHNFSIGVPQD